MFNISIKVFYGKCSYFSASHYRYIRTVVQSCFPTTLKIFSGGVKEIQIARLALLIPPKSPTALVVSLFRLTFKLGLSRLVAPWKHYLNATQKALLLHPYSGAHITSTECLGTRTHARSTVYMLCCF